MPSEGNWIWCPARIPFCVCILLPQMASQPALTGFLKLGQPWLWPYNWNCTSWNFWSFKLKFSLVRLETIKEGITEPRINIHGLTNLTNRVLIGNWKILTRDPQDPHSAIWCMNWWHPFGLIDSLALNRSNFCLLLLNLHFIRGGGSLI